MQETLEITREERFSKYIYEWVKTERQGDISKFQHLEFENDVEYVVFDDNSRIRVDLLGDVVLTHSYESEILGDNLILRSNQSIEELHNRLSIGIEEDNSKSIVSANNTDPVISILNKTKKRNEKLNIVLSVKIPSPEIYCVIRDNFDNVDDILLDNVLNQIQKNILRDSIKKELQNIYNKKKKITNGKSNNGDSE